MLTFDEFMRMARTGKVFSVTFIKRTTGLSRDMTCRLGVRKGITGAGQSYKPADYALLTVWDMVAGGYRNIALDAITEIRMGGRVYRPMVVNCVAMVAC